MTDVWAPTPGRPYATDTYQQASGITNNLALPDNTSGPTYDGFNNGLNVKMAPFNARGDGVEDDAAAIQACFTAALAGGCSVIIPPGSYRLASQVTFSYPADTRVSIIAYGAYFIPETGVAISGLQIQPAVTGGMGCVTVHGLQITQAANTAATAGFDLVGAQNCKLLDCAVNAYNTSATYAAFQLRNTTASDEDTACFWNTISRCKTRRTAGSTDMAYGFALIGGQNGNIIHGNEISNTATAIYATKNASADNTPASMVIRDNWAETNQNFFVYAGNTSYPCGHFSITGNRWEPGTASGTRTFVTITGSSQAGSFAALEFPILSGNAINPAGGTTVYVTNVNKIPITILDIADLTYGQLIPTSLMTRSINAADRGRSGYNLRGSVTLTGASQSTTGTAVTFGTAEPDAVYFVSLTGNANETFWLKSGTKATGGFTVNSSNATSTAVVDWVLIG